MNILHISSQKGDNDVRAYFGCLQKENLIINYNVCMPGFKVNIGT